MVICNFFELDGIGGVGFDGGWLLLRAPSTQRISNLRHVVYMYMG